MLILLVISVLAAAFKAQSVKAATITVPDNYLTIQAAINAATAGDTVYVKAGTYHENVNVNKTLSLIGEDEQNTVIDGGYVWNVIVVQADHVSITGFTLSNDGWNYSDIVLFGTSYCSVSGNILTNSFGGVYFDMGANNNIVTGNEITSNAWGIYIGGYNPNPDLVCSDNDIDGNNITNNQAGIGVRWSSYGNRMTGNSITANTEGISLFASSHDNSIVGNNIMANTIGVSVTANGNIFYHNSCVNNAQQVQSGNSTNIWDNSYPSGGNNWSDYTGVDSKRGPNQDQPGSDGIGDTPYIIDSNNTDHYPLMQPWGSPRPSATFVTCSSNTVSIRLPVTCTATVSGSNPTGTVTWSSSSSTGNFSQSVCTLSNGACSTIYADAGPGSVIISACYSGDSNNPSSSGTTTITVTQGPIYYTQNYTSVQATINAAPSGATVIIAPGFYTESLTINETLTIIGERDTPVFSGGASAIYLTLLSGASGSTITGIEITNFAEGILVDNASNCRIYGNIMASIGSSGIVLAGNSATGNVVFDNIFQNTPTPINLTRFAGDNTIYGNIITSQTSVTLNIGSDENVVYGNSMSGSQVVLNITNSNGNIFYHNNFLATAQLTVLTTGDNTWSNGYPSGGNYWSNYAGADTKSGPNQDQPGSDGIGDTPYTISSNNTDHYPLMKPWTMTAGHCVAVISVVTAKTVIGQGFNCNLTICAANNGEYAESFNVTAYANATGIGTQQISSLNASCQMVLTFTWKTAGLIFGNYTVTAYAQPVTDQTDMSGNGFTLGTVKVTIPGDISGDFKVSLADLVLLANAYGSKPGNMKWNPNADMLGQGVVGLSDLVILAQHYGQHYP